MEAKERKCYPPHSAHACSKIMLSRQFISKVLIDWTQLLVTRGRARTLCCGYQPSWSADLIGKRRLRPTCGKPRPAVSKAVFFSDGLHRLSICSTDTRICLAQAGEHCSSSGENWPSCLFIARVATARLGMALLSVLPFLSSPWMFSFQSLLPKFGSAENMSASDKGSKQKQNGINRN